MECFKTLRVRDTYDVKMSDHILTVLKRSWSFVEISKTLSDHILTSTFSELMHSKNVNFNVSFLILVFIGFYFTSCLLTGSKMSVLLYIFRLFALI